MSPVTIQDIRSNLDATIKRWEYENTEAAKSWRSWGNDRVVKDFVKQVAFNLLIRQWDDGDLELEYLRVDSICALGEAMLKPRTMRQIVRNLRCRALMRRTLEVCAESGPFR